MSRNPWLQCGAADAIAVAVRGQNLRCSAQPCCRRRRLYRGLHPSREPERCGRYQYQRSGCRCPGNRKCTHSPVRRRSLEFLLPAALVAALPINHIEQWAAGEIGAQIVTEEVDGAVPVFVTGTGDMW